MTLNLGVGWLCISSGDFVVQVNIFLGDGAFRIVGDGLPAGLLGEAGIIRVGQCPIDAVGKILGRLVLRHVSVVQVVYHFGNAAHVEADAGNAACHGFHNHVGQVLFQRRGDEEVYRIVYVYQLVFVAHKVQRIDLERQQVGQLLRLFAENDDTELRFQFGVFFCQ